MKQFVKTLVTLVIVGSFVQQAQAQVRAPKFEVDSTGDQIFRKMASPAPEFTITVPKFEQRDSAADLALGARALQATTTRIILDKLDPIDKARISSHYQTQQITSPTLETTVQTSTPSSPQNYAKIVTDFLTSGFNYLKSMPTAVEGAALHGYLTKENACNIAVKTAVVAAVSYVAYRLFFKKAEKKNERMNAQVKFA